MALWMLVSWESVEAEQRCEKTLRAANGRNMEEAFLGRLLEQADPGGAMYHVAWELLSPGIMAWWKDSENPKWPYQPLKDGREVFKVIAD